MSTRWPPRRIRVVGTSGSGKTIYARALADALGLPHRELDEVFWGPGWTRRDPETTRAELQELDAGPGWVVDGNWQSARGELLENADLLVWLDYPRALVMSRVVRRTLRRVLTREELWHGNRERPGFLLRTDPEQNIILWAWHSHADNREHYQERAARGSVPVVRLRSPRAARRWLARLERTTGR